MYFSTSMKPHFFVHLEAKISLYLRLLLSILCLYLVTRQVALGIIIEENRNAQQPSIFHSFIVQILHALSSVCLFYALSIQSSFWPGLAIFYLSSFITLLSISFEGIGAREIPSLQLAPLSGIDPSVGVSCSMLFFSFS